LFFLGGVANIISLFSLLLRLLSVALSRSLSLSLPPKGGETCNSSVSFGDKKSTRRPERTSAPSSMREKK
jgi:hypothetical protein